MILFGCVDVRFPEIEPPERIAERVSKALEEAYLKLKNLAQAARQLRVFWSGRV